MEMIGKLGYHHVWSRLSTLMKEKWKARVEEEKEQRKEAGERENHIEEWLRKRTRILNRHELSFSEE